MLFLLSLLRLTVFSFVPASTSGYGAQPIFFWKPLMAAPLGQILPSPTRASLASGPTAKALDIISSVPESADLPGVLADHGVTIHFVAMAPNIYARYSVARHVIEIDSRWTDATPETLAAVISHEATHAKDAVNGYLSTGGEAACIDSEIRAFRTSAEVWIGLYGTAGKPMPQGDLERQMNLIADRFARDPDGLDALVRQAYVDQCSTTATPG